MEVLWNNCLEEIEKQVLPENFNTWFTPTYPFSKDDNVLTIAVPNRFYEKCLTENYLELIERALETVSDKKLKVLFKVNNGGPKEKPSSSIEVKEPQKTREIPPPTPLFNNGFLNPKYNFDNFVVGPNNQFAHAAGQAVAGNPAYNYNPLFLYGAVGLGQNPPPSLHRQCHREGKSADSCALHFCRKFHGRFDRVHQKRPNAGISRTLSASGCSVGG